MPVWPYGYVDPGSPYFRGPDIVLPDGRHGIEAREEKPSPHKAGHVTIYKCNCGGLMSFVGLIQGVKQITKQARYIDSDAWQCPHCGMWVDDRWMIYGRSSFFGGQKLFKVFYVPEDRR